MPSHCLCATTIQILDVPISRPTICSPRTPCNGAFSVADGPERSPSPNPARPMVHRKPRRVILYCLWGVEIALEGNPAPSAPPRGDDDGVDELMSVHFAGRLIPRTGKRLSPLRSYFLNSVRSRRRRLGSERTSQPSPVQRNVCFFSPLNPRRRACRSSSRSLRAFSRSLAWLSAKAAP